MMKIPEDVLNGLLMSIGMFDNSTADALEAAYKLGWFAGTAKDTEMKETPMGEPIGLMDGLTKYQALKDGNVELLADYIEHLEGLARDFHQLAVSAAALTGGSVPLRGVWGEPSEDPREDPDACQRAVNRFCHLAYQQRRCLHGKHLSLLHCHELFEVVKDLEATVTACMTPTEPTEHRTWEEINSLRKSKGLPPLPTPERLSQEAEPDACQDDDSYDGGLMVGRKVDPY